jgi:hypothetical protein
MSFGTWLAGWATNDDVNASEHAKGVGAIFDKTLTDVAATVEIAPIIQSYGHLMLVVYARGDAALTVANVWLRFDGDSTANYDNQSLVGGGATASAGETFADSFVSVGNIPAASASANSFGAKTILIPHYAGSSNNKVVRTSSSVKWGTTTGTMQRTRLAGFWRSISPVTRMTLLPSSGNFVAGSRFTVYVMGA